MYRYLALEWRTDWCAQPYVNHPGKVLGECIEIDGVLTCNFCLHEMLEGDKEFKDLYECDGVSDSEYKECLR